MKKLNLTRRDRRRKYAKKASTTAFASKVKAVLNKVAEKKRFTTDGNAVNVASNSGFATWNLLSNMPQGTSTSTRIGDKIFLNSVRIRAQLYNTNIAQVACNSDVIWRIVLFRGKYDYTLTSYPGLEVFEGNSGSLPNSYVTAPIDLDQVTPLYDALIKLPATSYSGQFRSHITAINKIIAKQFNFREDDSNQKNSNLYLGFAQENSEAKSVAVRPCVQVTYTDI